VERPEDVLNCGSSCLWTTVDGDGTVPCVSAGFDGLRCDAVFVHFFFDFFFFFLVVILCLSSFHVFIILFG
jgi:hypothetical protein